MAFGLGSARARLQEHMEKKKAEKAAYNEVYDKERIKQIRLKAAREAKTSVNKPSFFKMAAGAMFDAASKPAPRRRASPKRSTSMYALPKRKWKY